jgi:hypothetical protein
MAYCVPYSAALCLCDFETEKTFIITRSGIIRVFM